MMHGTHGCCDDLASATHLVYCDRVSQLEIYQISLASWPVTSGFCLPASLKMEDKSMPPHYAFRVDSRGMNSGL